jgi:exodeoxyribonuclease-3
MSKGFDEFMKNEEPDIICLQETKMQEGQADLEKNGYFRFMSSAEKKGYSGTLVYSKTKPLDVVFGINGKFNDEGRVIALEYENFFLVNAYVPNAQEGLKRIDYRMEFEDDMRNYLSSLSQKKPVIYTGDLNVAHNEIDLKNPKTNENNAGYSIYERNKMTELLEAGFVDTFRYLYPTKVEYSWWSYRFNARANNVGWRIDYFIVSKDLITMVKNSSILTDVVGSDHAPICLEIEI